MGSKSQWISALVFWVALAAEVNVAGAATLRLNWQDNSSNESGFKIERLNGSTYVEIASVAANVISYSESNLTSGTSYCYRVRAFNAAGSSAPTNAACATAPTDTTSPTPTPTSPPPADPTAPAPSPAEPTPTPTAPTGSMWTDYAVSLKMRSADNDALGVMFRYQDEDNYYRFTWFAEGKTRRLEKRVNGVFQVLAQDTAAYTTGQTYAVQISAKGPALTVVIDGKTIFTVSDSSVSKGTLALYSYYNAGSHFDDVKVQDLVTGNTLLADDFNDGNYVGWSIVDDGSDLGPSVWKIAGGALVQSANIGSTGGDNGRLGSYALYTRGNWADYRMTFKMRSADNDRLGAVFRVQDADNYYRFSWDSGTPRRRLWKREQGIYKLIAEDAVGYVPNQTYSVEIVAVGTSLKVNIDGKSVFSVTDESFRAGTVGLYSCYNQGSFFDDVLVEDLANKTTLLWNDFNDGKLTGWKVFDEAGTDTGPSKWSVENGTLSQSTNIGSDATGHPGTILLY